MKMFGLRTMKVMEPASVFVCFSARFHLLTSKVTNNPEIKNRTTDRSWTGGPHSQGGMARKSARYICIGALGLPAAVSSIACRSNYTRQVTMCFLEAAIAMRPETCGSSSRCGTFPHAITLKFPFKS